MIIVGFILLVAAAVVAIALVVQNPSTVTVHAFTWSWDIDMRWLVVAGLALTAIGLFGLAMMRIGGAHYLRLRSERKVLAAENKRLSERAAADNRTRGGYQTAPRTGAVSAPAPVAPTAPPAPPPVAAPTGPAMSPTGPAASPTGPAASPTGDMAHVGAPDRAPASDEPHGIRERLASTRHRRAKG
ncbi:MAG TPA: LapA family protein [Jatrophihabitantaceae bacterium]|jgi:uncharacterized integral membrane protein